MENFVLENPTKIIFGTDILPGLGREAAAFGKKALLVYGCGSIKKNGIYDQVVASLAEQNIACTEHGGVQSNPVLSHVRTGIQLAKENEVALIIAVGGGSVLDAAKAIAAGAVVDHDVWKFFKGKAGITSPLPLLTVLTLAASGSEMNGGMVLTNEETRQKFGIGNKKLCPKVSFLDPTLTFSVPPDYTAYGAVDAIAHTLEFYFTSLAPSTPVQDRFMEGLIINLMESCNQALAEPKNYAARANIMWCATMALNGWTSAGLGMVGFPMHMIEHSISALYNVPHGAGLSTVIPAWMQWASQQKPQKFAQFCERIFMMTEGSTAQRAERGITLLTQWFQSVNSPTTLTELSIPHSAIPELAAHSLAQAKLWRLRQYDKETVETILRLAI